VAAGETGPTPVMTIPVIFMTAIAVMFVLGTLGYVVLRVWRGPRVR
jgi:hypothetical protein